MYFICPSNNSLVNSVVSSIQFFQLYVNFIHQLLWLINIDVFLFQYEKNHKIEYAGLSSIKQITILSRKIRQFIQQNEILIFDFFKSVCCDRIMIYFLLFENIFFWSLHIDTTFELFKFTFMDIPSPFQLFITTNSIYHGYFFIHLQNRIFQQFQYQMLNPITHSKNMLKETNSNAFVQTNQNRFIIDSAMNEGYSKLRNGSIKQYSEIHLDNNALISYIHDIYSVYNIPDPMRQPKGKQNRTIKTLQSTIGKSSFIKDVASSKISKLKQSLRLQLERTAVESQLGQSRINKTIQQTSSFLQNYHQPPVKHLYRYCIVCESMIQNSNILRHQKLCQGFDLIYKMNSEQLKQYLSTKIDRLEGQIIQSLKQKQQFNKAIVQQFLNEINKDKLTNNLQQNYNKLVQNLPKKFMNIYQLSYKIKWFRKVLEQIKIRMLL